MLFQSHVINVKDRVMSSAFNAEHGLLYVLEWTFVLTQPVWTDIYGFSATGALHDWSEPAMPGAMSRFYRLRQP